MKSVTSIRGQPFLMTDSQKEKNISAFLRNEGNSLKEVGKYFEALESFNKSLSVAKLNSPDMALAYAERSELYFEVKEFQLCLENIQLARDSGYPIDKLHILLERENDCMMLMEGHHPNPEDDPWSFFKLSYPANEKIPFIVNCIELQKNDEFGRFVIASQGQSN